MSYMHMLTFIQAEASYCSSDTDARGQSRSEFASMVVSS